LSPAENHYLQGSIFSCSTCLVEEQNEVYAEGKNQSDVFHGVEIPGQVADETFGVRAEVNLQTRNY
jgi:hypothetical protein